MQEFSPRNNINILPNNPLEEKKSTSEVEFDLDVSNRDFPRKISKERALIIINKIIEEAEAKLANLENELKEVNKFNEESVTFLPKILKGEVPIIYEVDDVVQRGGSTYTDNKWDTYNREYTPSIIDHYEYELNLGTGDVKLIRIVPQKNPSQEINSESENIVKFPLFVDRQTGTDNYGRGDMSGRMLLFSDKPIDVDEKGFGR